MAKLEKVPQGFWQKTLKASPKEGDKVQARILQASGIGVEGGKVEVSGAVRAIVEAYQDPQKASEVLAIAFNQYAVGEGRRVIRNAKDPQKAVEEVGTLVPEPREPKKGKSHPSGTTAKQRKEFGEKVINEMMKNGGTPISEERQKEVAEELGINFELMKQGEVMV